jgi:dihydrofolate synthase/folylpolyglutamate synthase
MGFYQQTYAVFGMMQDKDIQGVIALLKDKIDVWFLASAEVPRAATTAQLADILTAKGIGAHQQYQSIAKAYQAAYHQASENDRILVFGSFHTVAEALKAK